MQHRTTAGVLAASMGLLLQIGCMYSPANESVLPDRDTAITLDGVAAVNGSVEIVASPDPASGFASVVTLGADASGGFAGSEVLHVSRWRPLCGRTGGWETFVRADPIGGSGSLVTYDSPAISGFDGEAYVASHFASGDYWGALFACASSSSPVARVVATAGGTGAVTIKGDVVVDDPSDVDDLACVETIYGSLTVDDGVVEDLSIPSLQTVTGDLTIVYERSAVGFNVSAETVDLPQLATVGGSVHVIAPQPAGAGGQAASVDYGMPQLTSIGGDLTMEVESSNSHPRGFSALASLPHHVTYVSGSADGSAPHLLPVLTAIAGDLDVTLGSSTQLNFFNALQTVGGNATLRNGQWVADNLTDQGLMFRSLEQVTGSLRVVDVEIILPPFKAFDALVSAGELDWDGGGNLDQIGSAAVTLGGLRLNDNDWLVELPATLSQFTVEPAASVEITNNPNLPQCDAVAWANALPGHVGPVSIAGNLPCL